MCYIIRTYITYLLFTLNLVVNRQCDGQALHIKVSTMKKDLVLHNVDGTLALSCAELNILDAHLYLSVT